MNEQLALNLVLRDDATFQNFYGGRNTAIVKVLQEIGQRKGEHFYYLWGSAGSGRTHLLQAVCHEAILQQLNAMYVPLKTAATTPAVLQGLEEVSLVCLDDLDVICGKQEWEEAVFYLFNRLLEQKACLLITGSKLPKYLALHLSDLQSRLAWMESYEIQSLTDEEKLKALQLRAYQRGLELDEAVGKFLLQRWSRSMSDLFRVLDSLDKASLIEQRRLTIPFVKKILDL